MSQVLRSFLCCLLLVACVGAQPRRHGPVVAAYLTGLAEQLSELEYQINHREIAAADYARAKARLLLLRRFVVASAGRSRVDVVPELQVLCDDELGALGTGQELRPEALQIGAELPGRWKLLGIEPRTRNRERFFIFEQMPAAANARRSVIASADVVETIIVRESPPPAPRNGETVVSNRAPAPQPVVSAPVNEQPQLQPPRILHIYLPEYTDKARQERIEGELIVRALFQRDGKIKNIKLEKKLGQGLDERAIDAVRRIGFLPARLDGRAMDARVAVVFDFKLTKVSVFVRAEPESHALGANGLER